jgi:hypothetical protein
MLFLHHLFPAVPVRHLEHCNEALAVVILNMMIRNLKPQYDPAPRLVKNKLMETIGEGQDRLHLKARVVADDVCLGVVTTGHKHAVGAKQSGLFRAAVDVDETSAVRYVRFDQLTKLRTKRIKDRAIKAPQIDDRLVTEDYRSLPAAAPVIVNHELVVVSPVRSSEFVCFRGMNTVISNTKTVTKSTHRKFKVSKYARSYLAEPQYRFNRRFNFEVLVPRLLDARVQNDPRTLKWIRAAE